MPPEASAGPKKGSPRAWGVVLLLCLFGLAALAGTLFFKRHDIGAWSVRRGIRNQPWSEETRSRALAALGRHEAVHEEGKVGQEERERLQEVMDGFAEAGEDGEISEEEAGPLLERWEGWLTEAERR